MLRQVRNRIFNHIPIVLLSCFLLLLALFTLRLQNTDSLLFHIQLDTGTGAQQITPWKSGDGTYYLFLPSYCTRSDARIRLDTTAPVTLDGQRLEDGQTLEAFQSNTTYTLTAGKQSYFFCIRMSANVSTLYINTASGTSKSIHADKSNSETATVSLLRSDGTLDHASDDCTIRGRGNSTWVYEKRPYLLNFTQSCDLLDMGAANKWVLLANAIDESNLRNKLAYTLAGQMDFTWSPRCEYVDLYLNGEYRGLYLLAERVEIGESRLDIGSDPDSFLCKLDLPERLNSLENPFVTDLGRAVEITAPENIPTSCSNTIAALVQEMENAILGGIPEERLDIDSWVRRLLMDEVLENLDGDRASSYFYYTGGKFYAGPIWDYDHIMGTRDTNINPEALLAESGYKAPDKPTPYNNALYENPTVYSRLTEIYETEMRPLLLELVQGGLATMEEQIHEASAMNTIRWQHMFDYWNLREMDAEDLSAYLSRRIEFLDSIWLDGAEHYSVQVDIGAELNYLNFTVLPGECFTQLSDIEVPGIAEPIWADSVTGEIYTGDQPITRDTQLVLQNDPTDIHHTQTKEFLLVLVYTFLILLGLGIMIAADLHNRRPKRRTGT